MSSTLDNSSILATIAALETQLAALKAQLSGSVAPVADKAVKAGRVAKPKKERKRSDAPPTAWRVFADRVRDLLKANGYTSKALGVECVQFAATLKDENADLSSWVDADILARRAAWSAPSVSRWEAKHGAKGKAGSAANSVVSTGSKDEAPVTGGSGPVTATSDNGSVKPKKERKNPWAGLSDDERKAKAAKMAAAKAAKKATAVVATSVLAEATVDPTETASVVSQAPTAVASSSTSSGFQRMSLQGSAYWVNKATGHCYHRNKDGSQGNWAGIFHSTGGPVNGGPYLDDSVAEPGVDGWDESELVF